jgi:hypothetical protein
MYFITDLLEKYFIIFYNNEHDKLKLEKRLRFMCSIKNKNNIFDFSYTNFKKVILFQKEIFKNLSLYNSYLFIPTLHTKYNSYISLKSQFELKNKLFLFEENNYNIDFISFLFNSLKYNNLMSSNLHNIKLKLPLPKNNKLNKLNKTSYQYYIINSNNISLKDIITLFYDSSTKQKTLLYIKYSNIFDITILKNTFDEFLTHPINHLLILFISQQLNYTLNLHFLPKMDLSLISNYYSDLYNSQFIQHLQLD